jgi:hypothetical protein
LAGGAILALGSVLDWSGVAYSSRLDRAIALAAGVLSMVIGVAGFAWRPRAVGFAILFGVVGLFMGVVNYDDIRNHLYEYAAYPGARVGLGVYLVTFGSFLSLVAGILALAGRRRKTAGRLPS